MIVALKERDTSPITYVALSGLLATTQHHTQGGALGYHSVPFQGDKKMLVHVSRHQVFGALKCSRRAFSWAVW